MDRSKFRKIETEEEFVVLLKQHDLFREDDVTFDAFDEGGMYVYSGDDFELDEEALAEFELSALLVEGSVHADLFAVSNVLGDCGVFCVTGDVRCKDFFYMTEMTGVGIGGNLTIENFYYSDCGNSGLEVKGDLRAKLFFNSQCEVEVHGSTEVEVDEVALRRDAAAGMEILRGFGLEVADGENASEVVREYFKATYET